MDSKAGVLRLEADRLSDLFGALQEAGFEIVGPTVRDGAILYDRIEKVSELPRGWTDEQQPGHYRLKRRNDDALFGFVVGPFSAKRFLHPPHERLFSATKTPDGGVQFEATDSETPRFAFLGLRACELSAVAIQDQVFLHQDYVDPIYAARRNEALFVAVECTVSGAACFCTSMNTGPEVTDGFDIALTEVVSDEEHYFLVRTGSDRGRTIVDTLQLNAAEDSETKAGQKRVAAARESIGRRLETEGIKELFYRNQEHSIWQDVARRCLACGNCTMVCPTCFCTTVEDVTDLGGAFAARDRRWDSCFSLDFTYANGGQARSSGASRYRQWITHKLASWHDQFDRSGCVGCGRCITWCPVGIDITEESAKLRAGEAPGVTRNEQ